jgi:hypothetical protein
MPRSCQVVTARGREGAAKDPRFVATLVEQSELDVVWALEREGFSGTVRPV